VIVLNGGSSAGKSTLSMALQEALAADGKPSLILGWDDFMPKLSPRWISTPNWHGDFADDGCYYRVVHVEPCEALLNVGDVGWRVLAGYHRAVAAVARCGIDVIVEEVMITRAEWDDWQDALAGLDARWIAVHCDPDTAEQREHARGDRHRGLARGTAAVVHLHATYDVEVDGARLGADALAAAIMRGLS
jgi:chloramphenicol 3-O phosphotransferase